MSETALVLDGQSRAALETVQSLGRRRIAVDVASEGACLAFRSRYCRRRIAQPPPGDPDAFLRWLEAIDTEHPYRLLVPSTETSLRSLLRLPESHPLRRCAVLPSTHSLEIALSKQSTWEAARSLGVSVPRSRVLTTRPSAVDPGSLPLILKPNSSLVTVGGRSAVLRPIVASTVQEWERALDRLLPLGSVLEQEFVMGGGVGIECLYRDGSCAWHFQHERIHELPLTGGGSSYRRSMPADAGLLSEATRLLDSLGWHGVAMVEFKGSAEHGFRLMEINPRLWGSLALAIGAGVDFPFGLWSIAGETDPGVQPNYRSPYYARNLEMDVDWLKENLRADRSNPLLLTRPRFRSLIEYGRPLLGVERWDHFDLGDWRVWGQVLRGALSRVVKPVMALAANKIRLQSLGTQHRSVLAKLRTGRKAPRVLFLCYGNICRSPLAELYARKVAPGLEVASAGFHETTGRTAPAWFQAITLELGVDVSESRSKRVSDAQIAWADLVLLADLENLDRFKREFPTAVHKATMLGLFLPTPSPSLRDPYNLGPDEARSAARGVVTAVEGVVAWSRSLTA